MNVVDEEKQPLLHRTKVRVEIPHEGKATPTAQAVSQELITHFNCSEDCLRIRHIYSGYGLPVSTVTAFIYESKEHLAVLEEFNKKNGGKKEVKEQKSQ